MLFLKFFIFSLFFINAQSRNICLSLTNTHTRDINNILAKYECFYKNDKFFNKPRNAFCSIFPTVNIYDRNYNCEENYLCLDNNDEINGSVLKNFEERCKNYGGTSMKI